MRTFLTPADSVLLVSERKVGVDHPYVWLPVAAAVSEVSKSQDTTPSPDDTIDGGLHAGSSSAGHGC
jgi:hypothetical protein